MGPPPQMKGAPPRFYNDGRPMTPTGSGMPQFPPPPGTPRAMSPGPGRGVDVPRPLTPGGSRPASPAGGDRVATALVLLKWADVLPCIEEVKVL